jgi:hypothetical protein
LACLSAIAAILRAAAFLLPPILQLWAVRLKSPASAVVSELRRWPVVFLDETMAKIRAILSFNADELALIDATAAETFRTRSQFVAAVMRGWLAKPTPLIEAAAVIRELRKKATARKRIIERWKGVLIDARRRGKGVDETTNQFVRTLASEGVKASARTLYYWRLRFVQRGLAGLVDGRSERALMPDQTKFDGASKPLVAARLNPLDQRGGTPSDGVIDHAVRIRQGAGRSALRSMSGDGAAGLPGKHGSESGEKKGARVDHDLGPERSRVR